jgi:L-ascorbate metabolism protein UlaG (beta-lactamase superfamily)
MGAKRTLIRSDNNNYRSLQKAGLNSSKLILNRVVCLRRQILSTVWLRPSGDLIQTACPPITTAPFLTISMAPGSSIRTDHRASVGAIFCVGLPSAAAAGARSGQPGRRRPFPTVRRRAWKVPPGASRTLGTLLIQTAGLNILLDPVWSVRASPFRFAGPKRVNDPGIAFTDLPPIDLVLVSHGHYDHLDLATLSQLAAAHNPRVITPHGNDIVMRRHDSKIAAEGQDWGDRTEVGKGVAVTLVPTQHWSARNLRDRNMMLWASFVIETRAGRIYFVADSGYGEGRNFRAARERYGPFRLAILPIGAYEPRWFMRDQHMNPAEAVKALDDCGAELALAHHHGTFQLTDEPIDAPRLALGDSLTAAGVPPARFRVLSPGEVWSL